MGPAAQQKLSHPGGQQIPASRLETRHTCLPSACNTVVWLQEYNARYSVFQTNLEAIKQHNAEGHSWKVCYWSPAKLVPSRRSADQGSHCRWLSTSSLI